MNLQCTEQVQLHGDSVEIHADDGTLNQQCTEQVQLSA